MTLPNDVPACRLRETSLMTDKASDRLRLTNPRRSKTGFAYDSSSTKRAGNLTRAELRARRAMRRRGARAVRA